MGQSRRLDAEAFILHQPEVLPHVNAVPSPKKSDSIILSGGDGELFLKESSQPFETLASVDPLHSFLSPCFEICSPSLFVGSPQDFY